MVLTGVEIAGIVLAVLPLFATLLEKHKAVTRPYSFLLGYQKALLKEVQEFRIVQIRYLGIMERLLVDLALPESQKSCLLNNAQGTGDASAWTHPDVELALIESLGELHYRNFLLLLSKIWEGVLDISAILGPGLATDSTDAIIVLISNLKAETAAQSTDVRQSSFSSEAWKRRGEEIKDRAIFVLKSGTLKTKRERLRGYIEDLANDRQEATERRSLRLPNPRFRWPLLDLRRHASNLFKAMQAAKDCAVHSNHYINIQLDCRLSDISQGWKGLWERKPAFTVALGLANGVSTWHAMHVAMDTEEASPWDPSQKYRFAREDTEPRQLVENGICDSLTRSHLISFCVDTDSRLHEISASPEFNVSVWSSTEWVSMGTLLDAANHPKNFASTCEEAILLGLTLVCSFLQLYTTEWISDNWTAADVKFLRNAPSGDGLAYISMTLADNSPSSGASVGPGGKRGLTVLAVLLFELGSNKSISLCRRPEDSSDADTVKRCLDDLRGQPDCFLEAIKYCLDFHDRKKELDVTNKITLQRIAAAVVAPFQRDLKSSRTPAP